MKTPTQRFSDRVEHYVKYRPSYPEGVIETLRHECGLGKHSVVADIGSGTGIFTRLLLSSGAEVMAVEPNEEMRTAAERILADNPDFKSYGGTAEATGLPSDSVDLVTTAQAFHWFIRDETKKELARILRPGGWMALIWNQRQIDTPFQKAYDALLFKYAEEYKSSDHRRIGEEMIEDFFSPHGCKCVHFENQQQFTFEDLKGRMLSSSYSPTAEQPEYDPLIKGLHEVFATYAEDGIVSFQYDTQLYYGRMSVCE